MRSAFRLNRAGAGFGKDAASWMRDLCAVADRVRFKRCLWICLSFLASVAVGFSTSSAQTPEGSSSRAARSEAVRALPLHKLNSKIQSSVQDVVEHPSFYRRMPSQSIECDPQMFEFLVRRPEVMVNIWQVMGITKVTAQRSNPYSFFANDGAGTICRCDLIYSDGSLHIYYGDGSYDGSMAPRKVTGKCVCILRSSAAKSSTGADQVSGTMDVFLKLDNFGADLLARSVGPFVGKTADYNFTETAKFIAQISQICQKSPAGAMALAGRLDSLQPSVRNEFTRLIAKVGGNGSPTAGYAAKDLQSPVRREYADAARTQSTYDVYVATPRPNAAPVATSPSADSTMANAPPANARVATPSSTKSHLALSRSDTPRLRFTDSQQHFAANDATNRRETKRSTTASNDSMSSTRNGDLSLAESTSTGGASSQASQIREPEIYVQSDWTPIPQVKPAKQNIYMRR